MVIGERERESASKLRMKRERESRRRHTPAKCRLVKGEKLGVIYIGERAGHGRQKWVGTKKWKQTKKHRKKGRKTHEKKYGGREMDTFKANGYVRFWKFFFLLEGAAFLPVELRAIVLLVLFFSYSAC